MASSSDRPIQAEVTLNDPINPLFDVLDMPLANTEYSYVFPTALRKYRIKARGNFSFVYSNVSGFSTLYETVPLGYVVEEYLGAADITLYFKSPSPSVTLEIVSWT